MTVTVLHVTRAFSAQPTLGECLDGATVMEVPLPEAIAPRCPAAGVVWISGARPSDVVAVRARHGNVPILATPARTASPDEVAQLIALADLVLRDEGVVLAAAGLRALTRRHASAQVA